MSSRLGFAMTRTESLRVTPARGHAMHAPFAPLPPRCQRLFGGRGEEIPLCQFHQRQVRADHEDEDGEKAPGQHTARPARVLSTSWT